MKWLRVIVASLFFTGLMGFSINSPSVENRMYKCTSGAGVETFTNMNRKGEKCIIVLSGPQTPSPKVPDASTATRRAAATPTPADFPRVSNSEQRSRDSDRRAILDKELANEQQNLDKAKQALLAAGSSPADRQQALRDTQALHERNVEALKKELGNLR